MTDTKLPPSVGQSESVADSYKKALREFMDFASYPPALPGAPAEGVLEAWSARRKTLLDALGKARALAHLNTAEQAELDSQVKRIDSLTARWSSQLTRLSAALAGSLEKLRLSKKGVASYGRTPGSDENGGWSWKR